MNTPILEFADVSYSYPGVERPVLDGVSLTLAPGERLGLVGRNGSGKSTLLHLACGLCPGYTGQVRFAGEELKGEADFRAMRLKTGYLLQNSDDQLFCPSVLEDVAFGPLNQGLGKKEAERLAWNTLEELGITRLADKSGGRLSGGERKMAALASILSMRPEVLLLDEPGNDLDDTARSDFIGAVKKSGLPLIMVSHDWDLLETLCTRFAALDAGRLGEAAPVAHRHPGGVMLHRHPDMA